MTEYTIKYEPPHFGPLTTAESASITSTTTNRDWLFSLPLEEQYAWMNAEHVETPNATSHGDTAALNAKIAALTAELDSARRDRETYRELLGKAIDFAYAITLLVDEGAA